MTREQEPKGCPSCHAVAATWITDCENPIHMPQANAYIHTLEEENAALRASLELKDKIIAGDTADRCDLERAMEAFGMAFTDEHGGLDATEVITKFIAKLRSEVERLTQEKDRWVELSGRQHDRLVALEQQLTASQARVTRLEEALKHLGGVTKQFLENNETAPLDILLWNQAICAVLNQQAIAQGGTEGLNAG